MGDAYFGGTLLIEVVVVVGILDRAADDDDDDDNDNDNDYDYAGGRIGEGFRLQFGRRMR